MENAIRHASTITAGAIKRGNGSHRPAGHQTAYTKGKAGWKFLSQLSNEKAEYRVRADFARRLLGAARPRGMALLTDAQSAPLQRALVLVIVVFYGSALGRAWEVTGITRRA